MWIFKQKLNLTFQRRVGNHPCASCTKLLGQAVHSMPRGWSCRMSVLVLITTLVGDCYLDSGRDCRKGVSGFLPSKTPPAQWTGSSSSLSKPSSSGTRHCSSLDPGDILLLYGLRDFPTALVPAAEDGGMFGSNGGGREYSHPSESVLWDLRRTCGACVSIDVVFRIRLGHHDARSAQSNSELHHFRVRLEFTS